MALADAAMSEEYLRDLFSNLAKYKRLARYSFETRVEPLVCPFLAELLSLCYGGTFELVMPQFVRFSCIGLGWPDSASRKPVHGRAVGG